MNRSCTDVLICLIFSLFCCGMFATAAYGYANGNPYRIITPFDSNGNMCGQGNISAYPYLMWPDLTTGIAVAAADMNISSIGS